MSLSTINACGRRGFTLVELLVVVLILATLMAVAVPLYLASVKDSAKKACGANMQTISNGAMAWKVRERKDNFSGVTMEVLAGDIGSNIKCPNEGGTYSITPAGTPEGETFNVKCSITEHGSFSPGS